MSKVTGTVYKVYDKTFSGKVTYSIKLEDNPIYYRAGPKRWAGIAEAGNVVTFDAEMNDDGKSARITSDVTGVARAAIVPAGGPPSTGNREVSIHYQSARKDALEFVSVAVTSGALDLGKIQAKKLAVLEAAVDRYTAQFFDDIGTLGAVTRAAGEGGAEEAKPSGDSEDDAE